MTISHRLGTFEFFKNYILNQIKKEGKTHEVVARIHYSMSSFIWESQDKKDAFNMLKNLTKACDHVSEVGKVTRYL